MERITPPAVAPFTGAWIEIYDAIRYIKHPTPRVAPFTGAWIEILI